MNPVLILELIIVATIGLTAFTQILLPAIKGKPLFPLFRRSPLERELRRLKQENEELRLQKEVDRAQKENLDLLLKDLIDKPQTENKQQDRKEET